jgi:predicted ester cyclase
MTAEDLKATVRRIFEEGFNNRKIELVDEIFSPNYVAHGLLPGVPESREGIKQTFNIFRTAFPDFNIKVEETIVEGDKVVARLSGKGTHQGAFMGVPPTGKEGSLTAIVIYHFSGDKIDEGWVQRDGLGLMRQLGAIPSPE